MTYSNIVRKLEEVAALYPPSLVAEQRADIPRIAYNIELAIPKEQPLGETAICDVGGGIGLFSVGCGALGFKKVVLVDDFGDAINRTVGDSVFAVHRRFGVQVVSRDVVAQGLGALGETMDVVTTFDSMEHWHHSPQKILREMIDATKVGGRFVLGVPNSVNLRKRITVPLGRGKWSAMEDWYQPTVFRGHVREPDVDDLRYIAKDLGLGDVRVLGRNWAGYSSPSKFVRSLTTVLDPLIRLRTSFCSDIYLVGSKLI